ncbi:MAG TPA: molybdate ABC transporter substrate-binding protein [Methyloceanibacter sp.]|nr:molybdate ABC transporter substrate-binding protein [Methyloceanibacter sp.]
MAIGAFILPFPTSAEDKGPVVFAAASLKDALDAIDAEWKKESGRETTISYAASSALAKQIEQGAPADIFVSADEDWMNYLADRKLIKPETRFDLVGNRLVLIAPKDSKLTATIASGFPLASLLGDGHLAMADTASVPAGKYGKDALEKLGVWDGVKDKIAQAENVRAALALVSRGEAPLGIVYATDAKADPKVKVLDVFPGSTHAPILYPIAITASSTSKEAPSFLAYLKTAAAQSAFEAQGFKVLLNY